MITYDFLIGFLLAIFIVLCWRLVIPVILEEQEKDYALLIASLVIFVIISILYTDITRTTSISALYEEMKKNIFSDLIFSFFTLLVIDNILKHNLSVRLDKEKEYTRTIVLDLCTSIIDELCGFILEDNATRENSEYTSNNIDEIKNSLSDHILDVKLLNSRTLDEVYPHIIKTKMNEIAKLVRDIISTYDIASQWSLSEDSRIEEIDSLSSDIFRHYRDDERVGGLNNFINIAETE